GILPLVCMLLLSHSLLPLLLLPLQLIDPITYDGDDSLSCDWYTPSDPTCHLAYNIDVSNNIIRDTEDSGIIVAAANNSRVAHNTLFRVAKGLGAGVELWARQSWVSAASQPFGRNDYLLVVNNVVISSNDTATPAVGLRAVTSWSDASQA